MRDWARRLGLGLILLMGLRMGPAPAAQTLPVLELHLVLAFDVSASVNDEEFDLQRRGTARALREPSVRRAIASADGGIAISIVQWSSIGLQGEALGWHWLRDDADVTRIAARIETMPRRFEGGGTMIHAGLEFAARQLDSAPHVARRQVIDLSGNGETDDPDPLREIRDRIASSGIVINGLAIEEDTTDLTDYFYARVIGGKRSFVVTANDWEDFGRAMQIKLLREISGAVFSELR